MENKVLKRGYVKWTDETGFHKEPAYLHPELLADASVKEQIAAEEARRLNEEAELALLVDSDDELLLEELKAAPSDVLTVAQLETEIPVVSKPVEKNDHNNDRNED